MGAEKLRPVEPLVETPPEWNGGRCVEPGRPDEADAEPVGLLLGGADLGRIGAESTQEAAGDVLLLEVRRVGEDVMGKLVGDDHRDLIVAPREIEHGGSERHIAPVRKGVGLVRSRQADANRATGRGAEANRNRLAAAENRKLRRPEPKREPAPKREREPEPAEAGEWNGPVPGFLGLSAL